MKILIVNQPLNNRGDESAHKALVRRIRKEYPSATIGVLWINANEDSVRQFSLSDCNVDYINIRGIKGVSGLTKYAMIREYFWLLYLHPTTRKIMHIYKKYDWIICAPGGICMGGFQNWNHMLMLQLARQTKKKLVYYSRSFGPFPTETTDNRCFKKLSLQMLNYFSFLSIRDKKTEALADELKMSYVSTVDTAFLDSPKVKLTDEIKEGIGIAPYVVFVPNLLIWHYHFKNLIKKDDVLEFFKCIYEVIKKKYPKHTIVMLPQTFNHGTYEGDDIYFFNELKKYIGDNTIVVMPDTLSSDEQQTIIADSECMIGARYHSIVFAINNAVPFIALSYEHKIAGLLETLDKLDCMIDISSGLESSIIVSRLVSEFDKMIEGIHENSRAQKEAKSKANDCFMKLVQVMNDDKKY